MKGTVVVFGLTQIVYQGVYVYIYCICNFSSSHWLGGGGDEGGGVGIRVGGIN